MLQREIEMLGVWSFDVFVVCHRRQWNWHQHRGLKHTPKPTGPARSNADHIERKRRVLLVQSAGQRMDYVVIEDPIPAAQDRAAVSGQPQGESDTRSE